MDQISTAKAADLQHTLLLGVVQVIPVVVEMMLVDFPKATAGQAACTAAEMPLTSAAASVSILFLSLKMEKSQLSLSCVDLIQTTQDYSNSKG